MGFFGTYLYEGTRWRPMPAVSEVRQPGHDDHEPDAVEPWLLVDIHDSDFATLVYRPVGHGTGLAFLGITPRTYFEDERASAPTDVAREGQGLADWWGQVHPEAPEGQREAKAVELTTYLAQDLDPDDVDLDEDEEDDEDLDDSEVFVEVKTGQFLTALGLPLPAELNREP